MASKRGWTPLFLKELPQRTGTPLRARVNRRTASCSWRNISTVHSVFTVLFCRIILQRHATQHLLWWRERHQNCHWNRSAAVQQTRRPDRQPVIENRSKQIWNICTFPFTVLNIVNKRYVPAQLKPPWPRSPPAEVPAHATGQEVCFQTSVHRLLKILTSISASGWLTSQPHRRSFCQCRQESMKQGGSPWDNTHIMSL